MKNLNSIFFICSLLIIARCSLRRAHQAPKYYITQPYKAQEKQQQSQVAPSMTREQYQKLYNITSKDQEREEEQTQQEQGPHFTKENTYNFLLTEQKFRTFIDIITNLKEKLFKGEITRNGIIDSLDLLERNFDDLKEIKGYFLKEENYNNFSDYAQQQQGFINNTGVINHPDYYVNNYQQPTIEHTETEAYEAPKKEEVEEEEEVPEYVEEVNQPVSQTKTSQVQMQNAVDRD